MRPGVSGDVFPIPSRKSSATDNQTSVRTPSSRSRHDNQMTYFLADERSLEAVPPESSSSSSTLSQRGSGYGVQSMEDTIAEGFCSRSQDEVAVEQAADGEGRDDGGCRGNTEASTTTDQLSTGRTAGRPPTSSAPDAGSSSHLPRERPPQTTAARMLMPLLFSSRAPEPSLPSSPRSISSRSLRSLKPEDSDSMADDTGSQAIISSEEEEEGEICVQAQDGEPQLIMPSIKMPSRRPFTARGKDMGRLKVLIVGEAGIGKTSLIESIVQTCEHIVHVDPISSHLSNLRRPHVTRPAASSSSNPATSGIAEVFASTKPYPAWWSELDDSKVLRRRKSLGDTVLERNLCFVDTPGYNKDALASDVTDNVISYVEAQLRRVTSKGNMTDGDLMNFLSGNGGPQVDVVFFMISQKWTVADIDLHRRLSSLTNVIPLISKGDLLSAEEIASLKASTLCTLRDANLQPFLFGKSIDEAVRSGSASPPFAVSSTTVRDSENMDASLLMSSDYVQPLIPSELGILIDRVFEPDGMAWLRHSAAKKCILWRHKQISPPLAAQLLHSPLSLGSSAYAGVEGSTSSSALGSPSLSSSSKMSAHPMGATSAYALARVADHRHREERLAQVRLAKWATDLQRSLQNEKDRFEALARGERAVWLTERLAECVADGTLVPVSSERAISLSRHGPTYTRDGHTAAVDAFPWIQRWAEVDPRDPLRLQQHQEELRRTSWMTLQIVGGLGLMGGLAWWITRNWDNNWHYWKC